jgi:hypothetical protein
MLHMFTFKHNKKLVLGIRKLKAEKSRDDQELRADILKAKSMVLEDKISQELELTKKIKSASPVQYSADISLDAMREAVKLCLNELKAFYRDAESNPTNVAKLWNNIKKHLENVPNIYIFQTIMKQLDVLSEETAKLNSSLPPKKSSVTIQEDLVPKIKQMLLTSGIEAMAQKAKLEEVTAECSAHINQITDELEGLFNNSFEDSYQEDDVVGEFVSVTLKNLVLKAKIQHANEIVRERKRDEGARDKTEKQYATTVQDTRNIYNSIEEKVYSVQQCVAQFHLMQQKLNFGKISMIHLVQDLKHSCRYQNNRTTLSLVPTGDAATPQHPVELQAFLDIPIDRFNCSGKTVLYELSRSHALINDEGVLLLLKNSNLDISTLSSLVESMKKSIEMNLKLLAVTTVIKPSFSIPSPIPISDLQRKLNANREETAELLDQITKTNVTTKSLLRDFLLLYKYSLTNPLKNFVPATRKFQGKTYKAYENDYNLYYGMFKDS